MSYAETTSVPSERTQAEIQKLAKTKGATRYMTYEEAGEAAIAFQFEGRKIRFRIRFRELEEFRYTAEKRLLRSDKQALQHQEQDRRSRWRALFLAIKAKFESIDRQIETFDQAFLSHVVMPDGRTISDMVCPQIAELVDSGKAPTLFLE